MDSLLQFALLTAFAVSCLCYTIPQDWDLDGPDPGYFKDDSYPQEYIDNIMSKLSPEELEKLKFDEEQVLKHRDGQPKYCSSHDQNFYPSRARDEYNNKYTVVQNNKTLLQNFTADVCNQENDDRCFENATIPNGSRGCCRPQEGLLEFTVVPSPPRSKDDKFIKMKVYVQNVRCSCMSHLIVEPIDSTKECSLFSHHVQNALG